MKYYEIIGFYTQEVIGITIQPKDCGEPKATFGEISKKEFDRFPERSWKKPKSKKRFRLEQIWTLVKI